jgi:AmmeMemoRadiSam system protein B
MGTIRKAAVAGVFYPADPAELRRVLDELLEGPCPPGPAPKALIVPHAGWVYSGRIAATAYRCLLSARETVNRVVLVGPSHRFPFEGLAVTGAEQFRTPLGDLPADRELLERAFACPGVVQSERAHRSEHSLEVQLPFLQRGLGPIRVLAVLCGEVSGAAVARLLDELWGGPETVIVVSSDLSHYLDQATARKIDAVTADAVVSLDPDGISIDAACGRAAVQGLLIAARQRSLVAELLDLGTSADAVGDRDSVVGYGSFAFRRHPESVR